MGTPFLARVSEGCPEITRGRVFLPVIGLAVFSRFPAMLKSPIVGTVSRLVVLIPFSDVRIPFFAYVFPKQAQVHQCLGVSSLTRSFGHLRIPGHCMYSILRTFAR